MVVGRIRELLRWLEVDADDGRDLDGPALDQVGTITPSPDCIGRRASQEPVALEDMHVLDRALSRDDGLHDYLAAHAREPGDHWVIRLRC